MKVNVLIDCFGCIEYFSDGPLAGKYSKHIENASKKNFFTPTIVLYEVYKRIKKTRNEQTALVAYAHIVVNTTIVPLTKRISLEAAEISLSEGMSMADAIIKATANLTQSTIVTSDKHFKDKKDVIFIG
jgi:predicted nucleic acid-binding protein